MRVSIRLSLTALLALGMGAATAANDPADARAYARDPGQPIDQAYTDQILKFTTDPSFNSPLTDYLPASTTVPTPDKVLGHIAGAPNYLPYSADVYRYFRALAAASPRVKIFTIGETEEGREMIAVAIADESVLADLDANKARLAKLADPRSIGMNDDTADQLVAQSTPVYYITGTIHSTETGAPTALMELAYRLAVDDSPYIKHIRSHVITLITPLVEVDGRDRMVDLYNWHLAHPGQNYSPLMYWGHYVAHDNNRDAMGMTLNLTRNVADTYIGWHAQVLHDLHESVPFLYDNTVGDGPYNAWIDPILTGEWQQLGWNNVQELTKLGMPGVFTHGDFDTWSPGYLMFIAAMHNGVSRLYETFGNDGADTVKRTLSPKEYARTWYRPNPPLPEVMWSQRDNNNYEQTGLLTALNYFSDNGPLFLKNFYLKGKRSIEKPQEAGPAAYVFPADETRTGSQAQLLHVMQLQHVELSRTTSPVTVTLPKQGDDPKAKATSKTFAAGSYVVRMDQPYSRIADALLDRQYWSPKDPGLENLKQFVREGGLLVTAEDTAKFAIDSGMAPGVFVTPMHNLKVVGSVLQGTFVDRKSPIASGYASDDLALYSSVGQSFTVSNQVTGDDGLPNAKDFQRPTGRGGPHDTDMPEGRASIAPPSLPDPKPWQPTPLNAEQLRNNPLAIPADQQPKVIVRYADADKLLIAGLLDGGDEMAERAAVVDAHYGKGNVLLFAGNPIWRGETIGSYGLVFNAITHFNQLDGQTAKP
ncbi:hypothetical protein HDE78_002561 [Rhodanobacter sp. K2T2]|uniref:M14 family zinc carboxypeptidase n=1 Tax=Rhodanobacter sp. K2T2 TaxID=2723085 RepID=UPI0015C776FF|nr:M14 family zinc carboxypeptidase [Rhodanobacter sp. K2T2]NYE29595.1 hypothetical protein [Rhodanobacter sp. K2T2]